MAEPSIEISVDRMRATVVVPTGQALAVERLQALIHEQKICFGLDGAAIAAVMAAPVDSDRKAIIAKGEPVKPGRPQSLQTELPVATGPVAVKAGQEIGEVVRSKAAQPGMTIDGKEVAPPPAMQGVENRPAIGPGLEVIAGGKVRAVRDGVLSKDGDSLWTVAPPGVPARRLRRVAIEIERDAQTAVLALDAGEFALPDDLQKALVDAKVVFGLEVAAIRAACTPEPGARRLVVARARLAVAGTDSRFEVLIDDRVHLEEKPDGSVDFHEAHKVKEVEPGRELARIHPATAGEPGMDVRGTPLEAKPGRDLDVVKLIGEGAERSTTDPAVVTASRQGVFVQDKNGQVSVRELLLVQGDVDMSVGNIDTKYPVHIRGDVKPGFTVKSEADITIDGVIDDARVSAQGNLVVAGGIGSGDNRIKAHGDVSALYVYNRHVKARNLIVAKDLRHCTADCVGFLQAKSILGGTLTVAGHITAEQIGTQDELATTVRAGMSPWIEAQIAEATTQRDALTADLTAREETLKQVQGVLVEATKKLQLLTASKVASAEKIEQYRQSAHQALAKSKELSAGMKEQQQAQALTLKIEALFAEAKEIEQKAWIEAPIVHSGVTINIGRNAVIKLHQKGGGTYKLIEGQVVKA